MVDDLKQLEKYAKENNVPIMEKDGLNFLLELIDSKGIKNILEIGTAIGYSAIAMALVDKNIHITTIERDEERYLEAVKNINKFNLEDRITILFNDALDVKINDTYDLIFIDAAKAQNINFFEKFKHFLNDEGIIVTDNLNFHGMVEKPEEEIESKNVRALVRKIKEYVEYLNNNKEFETTFYSVGDKISVSKKV